jgi:hypothetical protein
LFCFVLFFVGTFTYHDGICYNLYSFCFGRIKNIYAYSPNLSYPNQIIHLIQPTQTQQQTRARSPTQIQSQTNRQANIQQHEHDNETFFSSSNSHIEMQTIEPDEHISIDISDSGTDRDVHQIVQRMEL